MTIRFTETGWADYLYWQSNNIKMTKKINRLIQDITRSFYDGIGKPEPLRENMSGWWSRRIDGANRIVYRLRDSETVEILQCRGHYDA